MWSGEECGSVAIAGPFDPSALVPWLDASEVGRPPPEAPGGTLLGSILAARLRRGMRTIAITSSVAAVEPIARWRGPLLRLWVVRRRARGALRDGYHEEVRLLRQALREAGAAVTHAHWTYEYARAALGPGLPPAVVTVHDHARRMLRRLGPRYLPHYLMARRAYRRAAALTAPSPWLADHVAGCAGRDDVRVIPNPLDDALVGPPPPRPARTGGPAVVTVASDAPFKNARGAVAALARWRARGAAPSLRLVGPGLHADGSIAAWARARGLADGVQFEGPVGHREALLLIADADILLHPSLEESFGNAVMEAMALGVPVVAAREAAGCRFLLDDGRCGRLASGRSPADLADALFAAWTRPAETAALAAAAGRRVRGLCDPDAVLRAYEACYATVAARS